MSIFQNVIWIIYTGLESAILRLGTLIRKSKMSRFNFTLSVFFVVACGFVLCGCQDMDASVAVRDYTMAEFESAVKENLEKGGAFYHIYKPLLESSHLPAIFIYNTTDTRLYGIHGFIKQL